MHINIFYHEVNEAKQSQDYLDNMSKHPYITQRGNKHKVDICLEKATLSRPDLKMKILGVV